MTDTPSEPIVLPTDPPPIGPAPNPDPEPTPIQTIDVTVGIDDTTRTTTVESGQVFIYAPDIQNPQDPVVQRALERAARVIQRQAIRASRRTQDSPLVTVPVQPTPPPPPAPPVGA